MLPVSSGGRHPRAVGGRWQGQADRRAQAARGGRTLFLIRLRGPAPASQGAGASVTVPVAAG